MPFLTCFFKDLMLEILQKNVTQCLGKAGLSQFVLLSSSLSCR